MYPCGHQQIEQRYSSKYARSQFYIHMIWAQKALLDQSLMSPRRLVEEVAVSKHTSHGYHCAWDCCSIHIWWASPRVVPHDCLWVLGYSFECDGGKTSEALQDLLQSHRQRFIPPANAVPLEGSNLQLTLAKGQNISFCLVSTWYDQTTWSLLLGWLMILPQSACH